MHVYWLLFLHGGEFYYMENRIEVLASHKLKCYIFWPLPSEVVSYYD